MRLRLEAACLSSLEIIFWIVAFVCECSIDSASFDFVAEHRFLFRSRRKRRMFPCRLNRASFRQQCFQYASLLIARRTIGPADRRGTCRGGEPPQTSSQLSHSISWRMRERRMAASRHCFAENNGSGFVVRAKEKERIGFLGRTIDRQIREEESLTGSNSDSRWKLREGHSRTPLQSQDCEIDEPEMTVPRERERMTIEGFSAKPRFRSAHVSPCARRLSRGTLPPPIAMGRDNFSQGKHTVVSPMRFFFCRSFRRSVTSSFVRS